MKSLLLGNRGFLGQDFQRFNLKLSQFEFELLPDSVRWPSQQFKNCVLASKCELVINCVSTREYHNESKLKEVHFDLPDWLARHSNKRLVNFSSDVAHQLESGKCVAEKYRQYAEYKVRAESSLAVCANAQSIRTSVIGLAASDGNLIHRFFISNPIPVVNGFSNVYWSGVTSLQLYREVAKLANQGFRTGTFELSSECVTMFNLFQMINDSLGFKKEIQELASESSDNRCMPPTVGISSLQFQLNELRNYSRHLT